ncbi:cytochrome c oxidase subunit 3 [uncultured Enterovirga sp.]|uniref:cytochrome c oxidase subunit 3 n=1 Tax=uncultured Enterovirga sp. TaxID=2026352 RepID=UPI0035CBFF15
MAEATQVKHDYHLVDPSPWPLIGSLSAFTMMIGLVMTMKGLGPETFKIGPYVLGAGILGVLYTMMSWWSDVAWEAGPGHHHTRVVQLHHRYGMMMFIASEVMFFVAWFWAYFDAALYAGDAMQYLRADKLGVWPPKGIETFDPWHLPLLNTLILLTSGTTVTWAHHALIEGDRNGVKQALWLTVALGVLFTVCQVFEYSHAAFGFAGHIYGATFFMATGFHGFHVVIGTIFLAVCLLRMYWGQFTPTQHLGFEFAAWYWHFVDVVWLFLFAAIYVWGSGGATAAH